MSRFLSFVSLRSLVVVVVVVGALAPLGCSAGGAPSAGGGDGEPRSAHAAISVPKSGASGASGGCDAPPAVIRTLDESDNGATIDVVEGTPIVIELGSNPTTGFDWAMSTDGGLGEPMRDFAPDPSGAIGAGGVDTFTWDTLGHVGTSVVTLGYARPWETGIAPAETFAITVNVHAATPSLMVGMEANGTTITVPAGTDLVIALPSSAPSGDVWAMSVPTAGAPDADFAHPDVATIGASASVPGAATTTRFTWTTAGVAAGAHAIDLTYARPGASGAAPDATFHVTVDVT